jgi:hypothetical protein
MATQSFHRGVLDAKIAAWNAENSYGTAYDILGIRNATISWTIETDQAEGDDAVLDRYSKIIAVELEFEQAAVDLEVMEMISGGTMVSNAAYEDVVIGLENDPIPYVAFSVRVAGSDGSKDLHFFVPKAKISGNLQIRAQYGQYLFPGAQFQGVKEGETNGMLRVRKFTAVTALEIPLRTTTGTT